MTTAKKKPRGALARLELLEAQHAAHVEEIEDRKDAQRQAALNALDRATLEDLYAWVALEEENGPAWARQVEVGRALEGLFPESANPDRLDAVAWVDALEGRQDGQPWPMSDRLPDFVAYFDEETRACDAALSELEGLTLPDGVSLDEARQVIQHARAGWKAWASMGRVLWGEV